MARTTNWNRRHFVEIAEVIRDLDVPPATRTAIAQDFAAHFEGASSGFDRVAFYNKCGEHTLAELTENGRIASDD